MGQEESSKLVQDDCFDLDELNIYQQLISMGYDDKISWKVSKKYKSIDTAVNFIVNTQNNSPNVIMPKIGDICNALEKYYKTLDKPYDKLFSNYCDVNGLDDDAVAEELEQNPTDCLLVDFDEDFPFKEEHADRKQAIFKIIQQCNDDAISCYDEIHKSKQQQESKQAQEIQIQSDETKTKHEMKVEKKEPKEDSVPLSEIKRIKSLLMFYCRNPSIGNINDFLNESILDITQILNDYIHIVQFYSDFNKFEDLYHSLNIECTLNNCMPLKRNHRNRIGQTVDLFIGLDDYNIIMIDIFDQIHCHLLHTFDIGYILSRKDHKLLTKHVDVFKKINEIVKEKRVKFKDICNVTHSKFITTACATDDDDNGNFDHVKKIYSFSYRLNYWSLVSKTNRQISRNELKFAVKRKYNSFKVELTSNSNICSVTMNEWNQTYTKAEIFITTEYAKQLKATWNYYYYGITQHAPITTHHLMAVSFYTDFDVLSAKFSATFRGESLKDIKMKNLNYYWFSKYLREIVECYGTMYDGKHKLYHGISTAMIFPTTIAKFNHPTSATKLITVAQQFATNYGIIIQLDPYDEHTQGFECSWISRYGNEAETLFVGGYKPLQIANIIECATGKEYKIYLHALNQLSCCIDGRRPKELNPQDIKILNELFFTDFYFSMPKYFVDTVRSFVKNTKKITINIQSLQSGQRSSYCSALLLSSSDLERTFVNMKNISRLFFNVETIMISPSYSKLYVSAAYFEAISSCLVKYPITALKEIQICHTLLDECMCEVLGQGAWVRELINLVGSEFKSKTTYSLFYEYTDSDYIRIIR